MRLGWELRNSILGKQAGVGGIETAGLGSLKNVDADSVNLILFGVSDDKPVVEQPFTCLCFLAGLSALASINMDILKGERLERHQLLCLLQ